ncbi:MAG TPA: inositol 2-dehydrogenase [Acetobacteraceae bacterium]|nr:inositol 2-dehydrogenase [Acetobacteraceae bacterium]
MIGIAVLGCGRIGRVHARNIATHPRTKLVACYDPMPNAAAELAAAHGAKAAESVDAVMSDPAVGAVLIASSTNTHVDLITRAVLAGKAVFCEKPIDLDLARVDGCWSAIRDKTPLFMIGFNRRFDPSFRALRERVAAGAIGAVEQVVITSRDPAPPPPEYIAVSGGLFRDMTIHDFDMARYLAGDIVEVQAMGANLIEPGIRETDDIDTAMIVMRAASGALVHINNSRRCAYGYDQRIEAFGADGMLQAHNRHLSTIEHWGTQQTRARDRVQDFFIDRYMGAYLAELDHFAACIQSGAAPLTGFTEGREALRLADAAAESARTGNAVRLAP